MKKELKMNGWGLMKYFLGLKLVQGEAGIFMSQERYDVEVFKKFKMISCNPVSTPMEFGTKLSKYANRDLVDVSKY